jgi:hypothetical protein
MDNSGLSMTHNLFSVPDVHPLLFTAKEVPALGDLVGQAKRVRQALPDSYGLGQTETADGDEGTLRFLPQVVTR